MRLCGFVLFAVLAATLIGADRKDLSHLNVTVPHVSTDPGVRLDYDIVYVRARRAGDDTVKPYFADFSHPVTLEPGADLMLLHPDGSEELLVRGGDGSVIDPAVSLDGQWVYYSHIYNLKGHNQWSPPRQGADIFKIHLKSRKIVRLTNQKYAPNTGAAPWSRDYRTPQPGRSHIEPGVFNTGPFPLPGGRVVFTSNRDGFRPPRGYPAVALQLFVMDDRDVDLGPADDPPNLEKIGHLNIAGALHPVTLRDGRIVFSSLESQGLRTDILWGLWTIHPDGTNWGPFVSAFDPGNGFHFQTQLTDGSVVVEQYYNQNNSGFGALVKVPPVPDGSPAFGPANPGDPRNKPWKYGRHDNGWPEWYRLPFMPAGSVSLTPFTHGHEGPAGRSVPGEKNSPAVGKFTHPSGAPDNHVLTAYSPGPVNHQYNYPPQVDSGIYLIKYGEPVDEPARMLLIKNDPSYNECWPRAVVPYRQIYGVDEPVKLPRLANDGSVSKYLPAGTPYGLIGTSSFYKRESYPFGAVPAGSVTARYSGRENPWKGLDPFTSHGNGMPTNWNWQGSDAGLYSNSEIHAVRILAMEPTTLRAGAVNGRRFLNHANERLRVLGEIPLRKFDGADQPRDPDGNPDTSFLARIPADTAFTFQTIDKRGLALNMSQTWHQVRPGEMRVNCGGCHAHSQQPTDFNLTRAAKPDYSVWDLVTSTPLVTDKAGDQSGRRWDVADETGLRPAKVGPLNVEYWRDVRPIFQRSCVPCHRGDKPAAELNLDADGEAQKAGPDAGVAGTYYRLALDTAAQFGRKPAGFDTWGYPNASRYVRKFQSRRSLLIWKVFGERLDGFTNDDHPSEAEPGDPTRLTHHGEPVDMKKYRQRADLDYVGTAMPPPEAVREGKVPPLTDDDRRTLARWIDLGCPLDQDFNPRAPATIGLGWMLDEQRPTLTIAEPRPGDNGVVTRILFGAADYGAGLNPNVLHVVADFPVDGVKPGETLGRKFREVGEGIWELKLARPITELKSGTITVEVGDRQGNGTRLSRTFSVGPK